MFMYIYIYYIYIYMCVCICMVGDVVAREGLEAVRLGEGTVT